MDIKMIAGVLALALLLAAIGIGMPGAGEGGAQTLPWQVEPTAPNSIRVFGLTLGASSLHDAELRFTAPAEISLFVEGDGRLTAEAYFDKVTLGGLNARIITLLELPQEQLQAMYQRGARISTLGSGAHKVTLSAQDLARARQAQLACIAYLPQAKLDEGLLIKRFGRPEERIEEAGGGTVHWLYPAIGLDVALDTQGGAVLQYVAPARFTALRRPVETTAGTDNKYQGGFTLHPESRDEAVQ